MLDEYMDIIINRIQELHIGDEIALRDLLDDRWEEIENPRQFGIAFSEAVRDGRINYLRFERIEPNGRMNVYIRI